MYIILCTIYWSTGLFLYLSIYLFIFLFSSIYLGLLPPRPFLRERSPWPPPLESSALQVQRRKGKSWTWQNNSSKYGLSLPNMSLPPKASHNSKRVALKAGTEDTDYCWKMKSIHSITKLFIHFDFFFFRKLLSLAENKLGKTKRMPKMSKSTYSLSPGYYFV